MGRTVEVIKFESPVPSDDGLWKTEYVTLFNGKDGRHTATAVMAGVEEAVLRGYEDINDGELAKLYLRAEEAGIKRDVIRFELLDNELEGAREITLEDEKKADN